MNICLDKIFFKTETRLTIYSGDEKLGPLKLHYIQNWAEKFEKKSSGI